MKKRIYINTEEKSISTFHESLAQLTKKSDTLSQKMISLITQLVDYYETLISCMPGNVYWMDTECKAVGCNQNVLDMFGLGHVSEFFGMTFEDMAAIGCWHQGQMEKFKSDSQYVLATGNAKDNAEEPPILGADGKEIYFLSNRVPLYNKNHDIIGFVGISTDISNIRHLRESLKISKEKAEAASQAKSEFIANMSHDLRTPITGILGLAQSWQMTATTEAHREDSALLIDTIEELLKVLNEILEVSKLDNGYREEHTECFSIRTVIEHNIIMLKSAARHKGLELTYNIDCHVPNLVSGNHMYLDRCVLNVLSNAIKFTHEGKIHASVSVEKIENTVAHLVFKISDTGIGIAADKLPEIFNHFGRLTASYQGIYKGTGLGLYTVKQYLDAMNGDITVESGEGQGSIFTMTIPFQIPAAVNVLIAEMHPLVMRMLSQILTQAKCIVDCANDTTEIIKKLSEKKYDFIFADISASDLNNTDTLSRMRDNHSNAPVIVLTGHMTAEQKQACIKIGITDFYEPPITFPDVERLLLKYASNTREESFLHEL